jgi:hypothetical protein
MPTADAAVFTAGVLPATEAARRHLILGLEHALETLGMSLDEAVSLLEAEIREVLSGRRLAIDELGSELAGRIAPKLPGTQRETWQREGPYAPGQPLDEAVVHFCLRILTLRGVVCLAPRAGDKAPFVLVDEWLGHPLPAVDPEVTRADLDALRSPPSPHGLRLLPPRDPYTQMRDREIILEKPFHKDVWRLVGDPEPSSRTAGSPEPGAHERPAKCSR